MKKLLIHFRWLAVLIGLIFSSSVHAQLLATYSASDGLTSLSLNGQTVMTGRTADLWGYYYALAREVPEKDWNWPGKSGEYFAPSMGKLAFYMGNKSYGTSSMLPGYPQLVVDEPGHFAIEQRYVNGAWITIDHVISGNDLILTAIIDNQSENYFQLGEWLAMQLQFASAPTTILKMPTYYPATDVYSPVTASWTEAWGVGINCTKHQLRPVWIKMTDNSSNANKKDIVCWMKNAPVPPGGRNSYTVVFRFDNSNPSDWQNLLQPYKTWFNGYFGTAAKYSVDFRAHVLTSCAAKELVTPSNPLGFHYPMDVMGWSPHLTGSLSSVVGHNIGPVIFWAQTGHDPREQNYRPDFDVIPYALENDYSTLRTFFAQNGNRKFGFCTRPGGIAYRKTLDIDSNARIYAFNKSHTSMLDNRFQKMLDEGATAFYLDSYGASVGSAPGSFESAVYYLKHLREKVGPHIILIPEMGFDAFHVYAPIWPRATDALGHVPYGSYTRWLMPGVSEICRVSTDAGAERVWQEGAVPLANESLVVTSMINIQNLYVNADGTSKVRTDCMAPQ